MADRKKRAMTSATSASKARKWQGIVATCQNGKVSRPWFEELFRHVGDWLNKPKEQQHCQSQQERPALSLHSIHVELTTLRLWTSLLKRTPQTCGPCCIIKYLFNLVRLTMSNQFLTFWQSPITRFIHTIWQAISKQYNYHCTLQKN